MKPQKLTSVFLLVFLSFNSISQNGSISNPFTSLEQSAIVTTAGTYFFNIGGQSFSSYVDENGYLLIAIDYGNASGVLPAYHNLATNTRGILDPIVLSNLDFFNQVRVSGPGIDYISNNQLSANRVRCFKPLLRGDSDISYATDWINNGGSSTTQFGSYCVGSLPTGITHTDSIKLSQIVFHACGNVNGIHWLPWVGDVKEAHSNGSISASNTLRLWIKRTCSPPTDPGFGINKWNMNGYSFNEENTMTDFNNLSNLPNSSKFVDYGFYTDNSVSINSLNNWANTSNPSASTTWTGCTLKNDNFVLRGRRKGFPTGFYKISLPQNDDGIKIYLNGVEIYSFNGCCTDKGVIFQGALCSTSELEVRMIEFSSGSRLILNIEQISWPVDAGIDSSINASTPATIGIELDAVNSLLTTNSWTASSSEVVAASVPVTVSPAVTTSYELTSTANGCSIVDNVTIFIIDPLPVELTNFTVNCNENKNNEITWTTASEYNSDYYIIENSDDGFVWNEKGRLEAAGFSTVLLNYSFLDSEIYRKTTYYRLIQVDKDGESKKYEPIAVDCFNDETLIYPNPSNNGVFHVLNDATYKIFDGLGNQLNKIEKSGVYFIQIDGKLYKLINF